MFVSVRLGYTVVMGASLRQSAAVCICKAMLYCTIGSYAYARVLMCVYVRICNTIVKGATPMPECCYMSL